MLAAQLGLDLPPRNWGGARAGAGRPRKNAVPELDGKPGVPHLRRADIASRFPVHVTMRVRSGVGNLRSQTRTKMLEDSFRALKRRSGIRVVEYSIQGNHLHFITEVEGRRSLSRGIQAFATRVARRLNAMIRRSGPVFVDRYHAAILRTPTQVRNCIRYVLENYFRHAGGRDHGLPDSRSSAIFGFAARPDAPVEEPRTWLLSEGWRRAKSPPRGPNSR